MLQRGQNFHFVLHLWAKGRKKVRISLYQGLQFFNFKKLAIHLKDITFNMYVGPNKWYKKNLLGWCWSQYVYMILWVELIVFKKLTDIHTTHIYITDYLLVFPHFIIVVIYFTYISPLENSHIKMANCLLWTHAKVWFELNKVAFTW